ncbi:glycosyl transferase family 1 [Candidatus Uhrbacteria bacterium CG_4_9_14_0_2_um_filter_41_50]|uniref:Glycosyl transferase family 1 n=1 Tax=Candidatus Uhrbacteria bacterium CG_4_9_14_0_2_um_filter_41_50 TaxID=1975031 RepID=A0A2M8ENM1_9BACT|nr:MAG: glycosyl transferase family 1 [Candidatus Uhrbacteria bacterium CG_4_10_14_3_um_filter_41_21]PIZ54252.1 MAG: glycosyl transferase family 1 [Candidatus Uhrbacteria bacterium CG_4_10_14_0_2_um_filter_41_21]PJB84421.1 MAG: glycosyl transferase family 1 [Candidatus Uhrbacteria bacterium CG_4_9_14_0_8_um_filter_41_16]PJC24346.1 MAG: glycosyl transferase family 1 [Candidatus Uhrbacteria bacterium CG_4_9_14_0_2_um_filter_41_50]PJE75291.1 MAG: glycosyl transferase family 1 [Candidatus Uhrbacter
MKIAMIGQKGAPSKFGGIETHVTELATRLVRSGNDVTVYSRPWYVDDRSDKFNGINIKILPSINTKHLDAISHTFISTLHACLFLRPDIIHFHGVGPSLLSWIPKVLRPSTAIITTFHCIDRGHAKWNAFARWVLKIGEKFCIKFADATIAVSHTLVTYISMQYGKRVNYIPNGITSRRVTTDDILLNPLGLRSFGYIAMVSRLVKHKGTHTLISAWKLARQKRPDLLKDLKLAIIGGSAFTDDYVKSLHKQAEGDDSIVFTGYQRGDALQALFAGAKFIVHPSTSEGLPIAILEAMSYGKAVIGSDIPENMEVIAEHGLPFSTGNIEELSDRIIELASDEMLAASIGHAAREFVEMDYHWDDITKETIDLYTKQVELREGVLAIR